LPASKIPQEQKFDKTNAVLAGLVFIVSFVVYALTVQRSIPFWDCGEFIACAYIQGIPHPPGTPLFVLLGRLFAIIPFVEDISYRINYISVVSSAVTAMFSYLLTVRLVGYFFDKNGRNKINRFIGYIGGVAGGLLVAFGATNWGNSVEAEVYGLALALSVGIILLTLRYFEQRGTLAAARTMIMVFFLAALGIGVHMTVFLVVPICSVFFILKKEAEPKDWLYLCGFVILELLLIIIFSNNRGGHSAFMVVSALLGILLLVLLYKKINWAILIAIGSVCSVMMSFSLYLWATPLAFGLLIILAILSQKRGWHLHWKAAMGIIVIAFVGLSVHAFVPIRSSLNPRIDENNTSRNWDTFMDFLDRKQYGEISMVVRMFDRRGAWSNQLGRHAHMGFWSYFEEQWSSGGWSFIFPFFLLGIIGLVVAIRKRLEVGLPFLTLLLVCSVGLVLYMNFADGTKYSFDTGDAYLEVRNRDYFFTPAFVFFGIAMGMGISAVMNFLKEKLGKSRPGLQKTAVYASSILVLVPAIALGYNYHACDRSDNFIPYQYAKNLLDTCEPNSILFTSGDNDTFPVWCIQEVYDYRKDIRVVNLSLLNTDWYTEQMKNRLNVPISLSDEQILWYKFKDPRGRGYKRPREMFVDRPRKRKTYLFPSPHGGRLVKVQDMMMDEIILQSLVKTDSGYALKQPIYFSSPPYQESPLNLSDKVVSVGLLYQFTMDSIESRVDADRGYDLFMNTYRFDGYSSSKVYRDENATGVSMANGVNAIRVYDELMRRGDEDKAVKLAEKMIREYPEYWQTYMLLGDYFEKKGDSAASQQLLVQLHDTLSAFRDSNQQNLFYMADLGLAKVYLGQFIKDQFMIDQGIDLLWQAFRANPNSSHAFRKLVTILSQSRRYSDMREAANLFAEYKVNLADEYLQSILGFSDPGTAPRPEDQ